MDDAGEGTRNPVTVAPTRKGVRVDELSTLSPAAADEAARAARTAAARLAGAADGARSAREAVDGWAGAAQAGFADRLVELDAHLGALTYTATAGASVIEEYSRRLGMLKGRLATVDTHLTGARTSLDRGVGDLASWQARWAEVDHWTASRQAVLAEFDAASEELADRLLALADTVADRPRRLGEHVTDAATAVVDGLVDAAYLPFGWAWDARGWRSTLRGTPGAALDAAGDPVAALRGSLPVDDVLDGRWGAAGGSLAVGFAGRGLGRAVKGVDPREHDWDRHLRPDGTPLPQSLPELLAGVDLERSEVFPGAHTIGRHVDVDDEFLKQRLTDGTTELGGRAKAPPGAASRWTDLETADEVVTGVLRANRASVESSIAAGRTSIRIGGPAPAQAGVVWVEDGRGGFAQVPATQCRVVLSRAVDGSWFVATAYLGGASWTG